MGTVDVEENTLQKSSSSYFSRLVNGVTDFGQHVRDDATAFVSRNLGNSKFRRGSDETASNLIDVRERLQRSYGTVHLENGTNEDTSNQNTDPLPNTSFDRNILEPDFQQPVISLEPVASRKSKRRNTLTIPLINIEPEPDFNFLKVHPRSVGGGASPARRSSAGFLSGSVSPAPTITSSFEFQPAEYQPPEIFTFARGVKVAILVAVFFFIAATITVTPETTLKFRLITTSERYPFVMPLGRITEKLVFYYPILNIAVKGAFVPEAFKNLTNNRLTIEIERIHRNGTPFKPINGVSETWEIPVFGGSGIGKVPESTRTHNFNLKDLDWRDSRYALVFRSNSGSNLPLSATAHILTEVVNYGALFGAGVIIGLYILIIFEVVNRTLAAMLAAGAAIASLAIVNERPTTMEMVSWLDMDTLLLLFSMMVIVAIFCETGFFDYAAYIMYKSANGQVWPLVTGLCFFTAFVSAFLDNVTTILLMTPVTIRICEAMELNPAPILISIVIFSNMGGAVTPVGDPPNVIIANNPEVIKSGIDFSIFSLHMLLGIVPVLIVAYLQLRITFRSMKAFHFSEPYVITELRREIEVWSRAADSLSSYSKDESHVRSLLASKVLHLQKRLRNKIKKGGQSQENFNANLIELETTCKIRDKVLLIKCGVVLVVVISLFFLHSVPQLKLSLGWTALLGAIFLLLLSDRRELTGILNRVEWSTLLFFAALFIVMEGVSRLGLLDWIGTKTEDIILSVDPESRLTAALLLILWVSGIVSAFIDNIPFTTMMIQIVTNVAERVNLPLQPLIWALAFGTCLGGNGTLIGASANVVCAGVADQHGYKFTFMQYFKIGFPMMVVSLIVSTFYLLLCHSLFDWNT